MKKIFVIIITILIIGLIPNQTVNANKFILENKTNNVSTSLNALVSQGEGDPKYWPIFSGNAQEYFNEWCDTTQSGMFNNNSISYIIRTYNVSYFYVIAHSNGSSKQFLTKQGTFYTAEQLREDMKDRPPIKLAFICCCEGMTDTGPGSLSYEFRKGQTNETVTIGFTNMKEFAKNGSMWYVLNWQKAVFIYMNRGYTVKSAFDLACYIYPDLKDYVKFVGDPKLRIDRNHIKTDEKMPMALIEKPNNPIVSMINIFLERIFKKNPYKKL